MYEITAYVSTKADLEAFLDKTKNFGKKFYSCGGGSHLIKSDGSRFPLLHVIAVAISRDMTYRLHWNIPYDGHIKQDEYHDNQTELDDKAATGKFPIMNAVPHEDKDRKLFYPYLTLEGSSRPYEDVFASYGFIPVHRITKDGQPLF